MPWRTTWIFYASVAACSALAGCGSPAGPHQRTMSTDARLQVAEAADAAGNTDLAALLYTQAAADQTSNIALQLRCADALARSGKVAQAREMLTARLQATASQPDLLRALALINLVSGESEQAIAGFDQLLLVKPNDAGALVDKAVALDLQGRHAEAQALYRQVLAKSPDDAATKNDLAVSMMLEGRIQQALETLSPMQKTEAVSPRVRANLGILYSAAGDVGRSRQLLGNQLSDDDLLKVTQALTSSSPDVRKLP
jgi:Flp pilus assembly protein TadD